MNENYNAAAFPMRLANLHNQIYTTVTSYISNARLEALQETEWSHSLTLVRSFAVRCRWLAKDTR